MRNMGRFATSGNAPWRAAALLALILFGWPASLRLNARPQPSLQAVTDQITYNVGEEVWLRVISPSQPGFHAGDGYLFSVRYQGDIKPLADRLLLGGKMLPALPPSASYRSLWKVPLNARAGRYDIDLHVQDPQSHQVIQDIPRICSFVIHRQVVQIVSAEVGKSHFTPGDVMPCTLKFENYSDQSLRGLRLEFSERYWPWIVQQTQKVGTDITTLESEFNLLPHQRTSFSASACTVARNVDQPTIKQYTAVVWDHERKNVLAIALTPLVFVNPPGVVTPRPYPLQYVYPSLDSVNTASYRNFHPAPFASSAIQFDTRHTQFPSGVEAMVKFALANPTEAAWRQVMVRVRLLGPDGIEVANRVVADGVDLPPHGAKLTQEVKFPLPAGKNGLFQAGAEIVDSSGHLLASNILELGVNPLPQSVLLFCAHEDDDGTQMGFIRSLVENQVPFHMVYFTSGDAGACDRYFQHTCGPAEALNFGAIRMQEARAAMGHLGVPPENILFLGLPDGGTGKIWYNHLHSSDPYLAVLLATDHAPYDGLFQTNLPYSREAVVDVTEAIIKKFQPEVILTVHPPAEGHIDHVVNNYFVVKALQELLRAGAISPDMELRVDSIFDPMGHPATPYHYEDHEFYVSGEAAALAQEAGWYYQSQGGNRGEGNLRTWNQLHRSEGYRKVLDWKGHEGWNEKE